MLKDKEYNINIGDLSIPYKLSESNKLKYIKFEISMDGLKIVKPVSVCIEHVNAALREKEKWIYKHFTNFQSIKKEKKIRNWETGESVLYKGKVCNINILRTVIYGVSIKFTGEKFEILVDENYSDEEFKNVMENSLRIWFKNIARIHVKKNLIITAK